MCPDCKQLVKIVAAAYFDETVTPAKRYVRKHVKRLARLRRSNYRRVVYWLSNHLQYFTKHKSQSPRYNRLPGETYRQAKLRLRSKKSQESS